MRIIGLVMLFAVSAFTQVPPAVTAACGPEKASFNVKLDESQHALAQPEPGKAGVYFIQETAADSFAVTTMIGFVQNAHPHRFRDTLVVDMLLRGATAYDVGKVLGDSIDTIERHYTPFVRELRDRGRALLDADSGLESVPSYSNPEKTVTPLSQSPKPN
jgi:hypothetical protein